MFNDALAKLSHRFWSERDFDRLSVAEEGSTEFAVAILWTTGLNNVIRFETLDFAYFCALLEALLLNELSTDSATLLPVGDSLLIGIFKLIKLMTFSATVFSVDDNVTWSGIGRLGVVGEIGVSGVDFFPKSFAL